MKTKLKLIPILVANLFAVTAASAADGGFVWSGEVGVGLRGTNVDGDARNVGAGLRAVPSGPIVNPPTTTDEAKFNEFRDLERSGLIGTIDIKGRGDNSYVDFFGENIARDDQYLNAQGGQYGVFKYRLYNDKMTHNLSWNALTPFAGAGSSNLTYAGTWDATGSAAALIDSHNNPATWNLFDTSLKRNNYGGYFELSNNSPWYIRFDANEVTTKGIRPMGSPFTNSSGNGPIDLPTPVDYKTRNLSFEGGYASKRGLINVSVLRSSFNNSIDHLSWMDPKWSTGTSYGTAVNLLPPISVQEKVGVNGTLRQLPLSSTLSGRVSYSQLTNSIGLSGLGYVTNLNDATPSSSTTSPSSSQFDGKIVTSNASLSLTSNPAKNLDTRLYWNWYDRRNDSTPISYAAGTGSPTVIAALPAGQPFNYRKGNAGLDLGYRIDAAHKLGGGIERKEVIRTVGTAPLQEPVSTNDNTYYLEYKNTALDILNGRLKYERINRASGDYGASAATSTVINPGFSTAMDTANFHQDRFKLMLDSNPAPLLDLGFQAIYKTTDYHGRPYGIQRDKRQEYDLSVSYGDPSKFRVTAFVDWEIVNAEDNWYVGTFGAATSATDFDVRTSQHSTNKLFGLGADWPVASRFTLNGSYIYSKTDGAVDFTHTSTATTGALFYQGGLIPFNTDNTTKHAVNLKGKYTVDKNWAVTGGYAFERYNYRDDQMNGFNGYYAYYAPASATNSAILSGAFQNPSYKAHIFYLMANYKFQ